MGFTSSSQGSTPRMKNSEVIDLELQVAALKAQLRFSKRDNERKDAVIESLQSQLHTNRYDDHTTISSCCDGISELEHSMQITRQERDNNRSSTTAIHEPLKYAPTPLTSPATSLVPDSSSRDDDITLQDTSSAPASPSLSLSPTDAANKCMVQGLKARIAFERNRVILRKKSLASSRSNSPCPSTTSSCTRRNRSSFSKKHQDGGDCCWFCSSDRTISQSVDEAASTSTIQDEQPKQQPSSSVQNIVEKIQQWLFLEGGKLRDVESLITEYCKFCRSIGIPLDRLFIAGMMLHKTMSAYVWKWEVDQEFEEHQVPRYLFEKPNYNPDEPFAILMEGRAVEYRMKAADADIPPGCAWFHRDSYQDYLALPIRDSAGEFKGAMAWSTKSKSSSSSSQQQGDGGFSQRDIDVFHESLASLSAVLRLHTNDLVLNNVTAQLEEEISARTRDLATANEELARANARLKDQAEAQLRHFSMMAHEIRTPLNCVVAISTMLLDPMSSSSSLDPDVEDSIRMITTSSDLLLAVVDDVLDYSKLEVGKMEIVREATHLSHICKTVLSSIRMKAKSSGLSLRLTYDKANLPSVVYTDGRRLQQVLYNLLGNAIKFGAVNGGEHVDFMVQRAVTATPDGNKKDMVQFIIKDYGQGIAQDQFDEIFKPFQQVKSTDSKFGGTGLGLAITNKIVQALEGTISVSSKQGEWTEFQCCIPILEKEDGGQIKTSSPLFITDENNYGENCSSSFSHDADSLGIQLLDNQSQEQISAHNDEDSVPAFSSSSSSLSLRRTCDNHERTESSIINQRNRSIQDLVVLVAEDNRLNQKVLHRILIRMGLQHVQVANNGAEAVEACASRAYDLILMDFDMPVMNGVDATRSILHRKSKAGQSPTTPKIVFLTAHALQEHRSQVRDAGGHGFISKPFKMNQMKKLFALYLQDGLLDFFE